MFLTQIKSFPKTQFWRYILGFALIAWFYILGQIPLFIGWIIKKGEEVSEQGLLNQIIKGFENLQDTPQRDLMGILPNNTTLILALLMFLFTLFGILLALKWCHNQKLKQITTARMKVDWKRIFFSFGLLATFSIITTFLSYWSTPEDYIWNFNWEPFLILLVIVVTLLPIQTSVEEWIFRGYLMQGFYKATKHRQFFIYLIAVLMILLSYYFINSNYEMSLSEKIILLIFAFGLCITIINFLDKKNVFTIPSYRKLNSFFDSRFTPLIITSVTFGLMHLANPEMEELGYYAMVFYIGTGLFLGILTLMDDGLELALGFHAANNMITALLVTADYSVLQTDAILKQTGEPEVGWQIILPVLVLYPIFLFIFAKKYKWSNWKERLFGSI